MHLQDVPSPKPRLLKRDFNAGKRSASLTIQSHGYDWTAAYFNDKIAYSRRKAHEFSRQTASYWSGYRAGLVSYKEATDE